jgi:hypothetical protein
MKKWVIVLVLAGAVCYGLLGYHWIVLDDELKILKKASPSFADTFVDARGINRVKLFTNPALLKAGIKDAIE